MTHSSRIVLDWRELIWGDRQEGSEYLFQFEGNWYMVTTGTGDCDGGCFAFDLDDVERWLESDSHEKVDAYQRFCDSVSPCEDVELAQAIKDSLDLVLFRAGICAPILGALRSDRTGLEEA